MVNDLSLIPLRDDIGAVGVYTMEVYAWGFWFRLFQKRLMQLGFILLCKSTSLGSPYGSTRLSNWILTTWAHLESFQAANGDLQAVPLLDSMKGVDDQRFLKPTPAIFLRNGEVKHFSKEHILWCEGFCLLSKYNLVK